MALLNEYAELDDLGDGRLWLRQAIKKIAYREAGSLRRMIQTWTDSGDSMRPHLVSAAPIMVSVADDGMRRIHPTRELDRYVELGAPFVKVGGVWQQISLGQPTRSGNRLQWTRPQANMYVDFGGHFVKLAILLKNGYVPEDNQIAFPVGMSGFTRQGRELLREGEVVAFLQPPVMLDWNNPEDIRPIDGQFVALNGQPYWHMTLPNLTGMSMPVIDPTLTQQPSGAAGQDVRIINSVPTTNFGVDVVIGSGENNSAAQTCRTLIKFDLSSLPDAALILSATLSLKLRDDRSNNTRLHRVYRVKRAWAEGSGNGTVTNDGATWNTYDGVNAWQTAGAFGANDCEQTDIGSLSLTASETVGTVKNWSLAAANKSALDLGNGWLLKTDTEADDLWTYYSSDDATAANRPQLVIDYSLLGRQSINRGVERGVLRGAR